MPKKIDPLNKKHYGAMSIALTVADMKAAAEILPAGLRLHEAQQYERSQWQSRWHTELGTPRGSF